MSVGASIRRSTAWLLSGNIAGQVLQFAFGIVLARLLEPADFGMLVTIQIFTGLAAFVSGAGMGQALVRSKTVADSDFHAVFTFQLLVGMAIYAAFFSAAPWFAHYFGNPLYADLMRVSALYFALRPFGNLANIWLTREMHFRTKAIITFWGAILTGALSITFASLGFKVWSLVFGGMIATVVTILWMLAAVPVRPRWRFDVEVVKRFGAYGFKTTLNDFVSYVRSQTTNFVLSRMGGAAIVGLYNKAESLARAPSAISGAVYDPIFRSMAKAQDDLDQTRYIYLRTITLLTVYMLPVFVGLAWLAEPLVILLYGQKWAEAGRPLSILCLGGVFVCLGHPAGAVLAARNWLGREAVVHAVSVVLIAVAAIFGLHWGLPGVAWGMLLVHAYSTLGLVWLVSRCIGVTLSGLARSLAPGLLLNLVFVAALGIFGFVVPSGDSDHQRAIHILGSALVGAVTYGLAFFFIPLVDLAPERKRWKQKIGLVANG